jgi:hypothetical protein
MVLSQPTEPTQKTIQELYGSESVYPISDRDVLNAHRSISRVVFLMFIITEIPIIVHFFPMKKRGFPRNNHDACKSDG